MISRLQTCQPSRFWPDSPDFLPDIPRPAKSWKCPAFCTKSDFFLCAQFVTLPRCPDIMQITQLNVITEIPFDFSQKYQTVPRPNRRATVYFGTQNLNVGPANRPAFFRQVLLFYAKYPSKDILQVGRSETDIYISA